MAIKLIKNPDERNDPPKPLLEHLLALRDMLVFAAVSWAIGVIVVGCVAPRIMDFLVRPAEAYRDLFQVTGVASSFDVWMSIAFWGGTILSFPAVVFAILRFVFPALTNKEKFVIVSGMTISTSLFVVGAFLAYAKTLGLVVSAFNQLGRWMHINQDIITLDTYIPLVIKMIVAFGLVFQVPLMLFVLGCFGIVTSRGLREKRRISIVVSFVLAMVLTPPDPMSQIVMALPLCILYEAAIWAIWLKEKATFTGRKKS